MITLFIVLLVTACLGLGLMVLIQNPKGGGLNANVSGLSNTFMGVKQTTDVLEKGTWIFAGVIAVLAITSTLLLTKTNTTNTNKRSLDNLPIQTAPKTPVQTAPQQTAPVQTAPPAAKKP